MLFVDSVRQGGMTVELLSVLLLSVSLAADAMAAAVCCGLDSRGRTFRPAVMTGVFFGFFQMLMPVLGWSIGRVGGRLIQGAEPAVAGLILLLLGVKMLLDARTGRLPESGPKPVREMLLLAVATSMDALAAGAALPAAVGAFSLGQMLLTAACIGSVTFLMSAAGFAFGRQAGRFRPRYAMLLGGLLLILIGIKTLTGGL